MLDVYVIIVVISDFKKLIFNKNVKQSNIIQFWKLRKCFMESNLNFVFEGWKVISIGREGCNF